MKKISLFFAALLMLAMSAIAIAAPTAADVTEGVLSETNVLSFGIRDMRAMEAEIANGSLIGRIIKRRNDERGIDQSRMAACADTSVRVGFKTGEDGMKTVVFAARLVEGASENDLLKFPDGKNYKPDFKVSAPLKALATIKYENEGMKALRFARLELDGRVYLLATNGGAAIFKKMAAAKESAPAQTHEEDTFWCNIDSSKELMAAYDIEVDETVKTEITFASSETTLYMHVWSSLMNSMKDGVIVDAQGNPTMELLSEELTASEPLLFGAGPLMGIFNLCCASLPENIKPAQVFDDKSMKVVQPWLDDLKAEAGLEWSDIVSILRHNTTIGIAGKVNILGSEFPGFWLLAQGLTGKKAEALVAAIKKEIGILGNSAVDFEESGWKGFSLTQPVAAMAASGPKGVVVALMDKDQLTKVPEIPERLANTVDPRGIALGLNFKDLQPELLKIYERFNTLIPALNEGTDEENEAKKESVKAVLNNLGMLDTVQIFATGSECFALEITPDPEFLNVMFPPVLPEKAKK